MSNCSGCGSNGSAIDGIVCNVVNCKYHSTDCRCEADEIKVGPGYATSSADTVCDTFIPKSDL